MYELTLTWTEAEQVNTYIIRHPQPSQHPGGIRIGRDPVRCDLVLSHPTVSGLHVEVFFQPDTHQFCVRNLRDRNPPVVDGQPLFRGEVALHPGSTLLLGELLLTVTAIAAITPTIATTILLPPPPAVEMEASPSSTPSGYGLMCPKCHQVSAYERLGDGCLWCGTSLAAAASVILSPLASAG